MRPFSDQPRPARGVMLTLRVTAEEAARIDELARRIGVATRAAVLRAGLDALAARPADREKKKP